MTLVAAFANRDFAVIVADRRRTQIKTKVSVDDVVKIHQLNDNVAVGFSGCYEYVRDGLFIGNAEKIINMAHPLVNRTDTVESIVETYLSKINQLLRDGMRKDQLEVTFHFAGLTNSGNYGLGRLSVFEDFEPVFIEAPPEGITWGLSRANYSPTFWLESRIAALKEINIQSVQDLAIQLVEHTAENDGYVSGTYDMLTI